MIASEFAIILTGIPCALTFKKWFIFQGLLCTQREGMFYIFATWFVVRNFRFRLNGACFDSLSCL